MDDRLREQGYVVIPFLGPAEVHALRDFYWQSAPEDDSGMVFDYMLRDRAVMHRTRNVVEPVFDARSTTHLVDQRLVLATFVVKHPGGPESTMYLHDDRSYVDERRHRTCTLWIPLVDTGPDHDNGGLQILPKSQMLPTGMSGSLTPDLIRPYEAHLRSMLVDVEVPAGHALVYDTRVLHASPENRSDRPREALVLAVGPRGAPLIHVVATGRRHRRVHAIDERFFLDHHVRDVEVAIGSEFPVVAEFDDHHELRPEDVGDALGCPVPARQVVLPGDLHDGTDVAELTEIPSHPILLSHGTSTDDLLVAAADVDASAGTASPVAAFAVTVGTAAVSPVRRRFRTSTDAVTADIVVRAPIPRTASDADVVVLDPGARMSLAPPAGGTWSHHLTVAECPRVSAGARAGGAAAILEPARRFELDRPTTLWNDGPGPLAAVVSRSPTILVRAAATARRAARARR
jgi:hypothetical protein